MASFDPVKLKANVIIFLLLIFMLVCLTEISYASWNVSSDELSPERKQEVNFNRKKYFENFIDIPLALIKEVLRTDAKGLKRNAFLAGIIGGSAYFLDQDIRDYTQENIYAGDNLLSEFLYNAGNKKNILVFYSGGYLLAQLKSDRYLENTLYYSLQSLLVSQGFAKIFKETVNRDRPRNSPDDPFSRTGGNSFISGHASGSWAVMTVFAERYPASKLFTYGLASLVAVSRIYEDAHWLSDVLAGSIIGYGVGKFTLSMNDAFPHHVSISPVFSGDMNGVAVNLKF